MTEKFQPTIPSLAVYGWESQAPQYPETGEPGISFEVNEIPDVTTVNCLLWRDKDGVLRAVLNHFPKDVHLHGRRVEKAGNINIYVDPGWKRRRLATMLLDEAFDRFGPIDLKQQEYTPEGALFARRYMPAELVAVVDLRVNDLVDLTGDPYADPGHGTDGHECNYPDGSDLTIVGGEDGPGELENASCYRLDHSDGAIGFPPDHKVRRVGVYTADPATNDTDPEPEENPA